MCLGLAKRLRPGPESETLTGEFVEMSEVGRDRIALGKGSVFGSFADSGHLMTQTAYRRRVTSSWRRPDLAIG